jgi:hypothetical protein
MLELKSILEEWKAVPGSLEIASSLHSDVALCRCLLPRSRHHLYLMLMILSDTSSSPRPAQLDS